MPKEMEMDNFNSLNCDHIYEVYDFGIADYIYSSPNDVEPQHVYINPQNHHKEVWKKKVSFFVLLKGIF